MGIIEQAAKRLDALREAGIQVRARDQAVSRIDKPTAPAPLTIATAQPMHEGGSSKRVDIDIARLAEAGYIVPDGPRTELSEQFRVIKRPLINNIRGKDGKAAVARGNLIMVTSALAGEGKTFTSVNLALSMAMELDSHVLLIDADVRHPSVFEQLGLAPQEGLMDILEDPDRPLTDVLLQTNIEKLSLLPAGAARERSTEYLSSERMRRLLDQLRTRYPDRILIFDAPPLLPSTESRALAAQMGQVIFVVAEGQTPCASLSEALATLEGCPIVLPLLNKSAKTSNAAYGVYGIYGSAYEHKGAAAG